MRCGCATSRWPATSRAAARPRRRARSRTIGPCRRRQRGPRGLHQRPRVAALEVVVDQAHRLHEGVDRGRADEAPAAPLQVLRQRDRFGRALSARSASQRQPLRPRRRGRLEAPGIGGERAEFARAARARGCALLIVDSILPRWRTMPASPSRRSMSRVAEARHRAGVEAGEGGAEGLALVQDREPGQARLEAFEAQLLEQLPVVGRPAGPTPRRDRRGRPASRRTRRSARGRRRRHAPGPPPGRLRRPPPQPNGRTPISGACSQNANTAQATTPIRTVFSVPAVVPGG